MAYLWSQPGFPHKGWRCVGIHDLRDDGPDYTPGTCEACGNGSLRFVHTMHHDDWDDITVGCDCAGKLEEDYVRAKAREKRLANRSRRRNNWLTREWRVSQKGNTYLNVKGCNVGVCPDNRGRWRYWIKSPATVFVGNSAIYDSMEKAKLALFDELDKILRRVTCEL